MKFGKTKAVMLAATGVGAAPHVCLTHKAIFSDGGEVNMQVLLDDDNRLYVSVDADEFTHPGEDCPPAAFLAGECFDAAGAIRENLDEYCQQATPFKSIFMNFEAAGHPTLDGFGGGYGVPHWDIHFYTTLASFPESLTCPTVPGTPACDVTSDDPRVPPFLVDPPAAQMTGFFHDTQFGGHAVNGHGNHLIAERDALPAGPAVPVDVDGNLFEYAEGPSWLPCAMQAGGAPDMGCRFNAWEGLSPILIAYGGEVIGAEPMMALALASKLQAQTQTSVPYTAKTVVQWPVAQESPFNPAIESIFAEVTAEGTMNSGFQLAKASKVGAACDPAEDKPCHHGYCSPNEKICKEHKEQGEYCNVVQECTHDTVCGGSSLCISPRGPGEGRPAM